MAKGGTNSGKELDWQWQKMGLTVAKRVRPKLAKRVGLTVEKSGTNSGKDWD